VDTDAHKPAMQAPNPDNEHFKLILSLQYLVEHQWSLRVPCANISKQTNASRGIISKRSTSEVAKWASMQSH
jgi:hypothetical protein